MISSPAGNACAPLARGRAQIHHALCKEISKLSEMRSLSLGATVRPKDRSIARKRSSEQCRRCWIPFGRVTAWRLARSPKTPFIAELESIRLLARCSSAAGSIDNSSGISHHWDKRDRGGKTDKIALYPFRILLPFRWIAAREPYNVGLRAL